MTASEVGKNCWKTSLQWEVIILVGAETVRDEAAGVDQHVQLWMRLVCAKFVLQLLPDN